MIMRATQKKRMSKPVISTTSGRTSSSSGVSSGQPEGRERPEPGGEPGVEHVRVLARAAAPHCGHCGRDRVARRRHAAVSRRSTRRGCGGPTRAGARCTSRGCSPSSRSRSCSSCAGRSDPAVFDRLDGRLGERLDLHEPLLRDERLDHRLAAVATPDGVAVGLDPVDERRAPAGPPRCACGLRSDRGPRTCRPAAVILPSSPMTLRSGRLWRRPISKSFGSWPA